MADIQKLKSLIADWESTSDDIPFGLDEDDRVILEAMKFAADNHGIVARLEAAEELNNHLELAVRKAEGVSEALRKRAEDAENKLLFTRAAPPSPVKWPEWTDQQCLEFICIAFRHAEISGDIEMDDIRLAMKVINGGSVAE